MPKKRSNLVPRGVVPDQPAHYVGPGAFTAIENVSFRNARVQRVGGMASIWQETNPFTFEPRHLLYAPFQGIGYWIICDKGAIFVTDGVTHNDISPGVMTAAENNEWTSAELNGLAVLNNPNETPVYWDGNTVNPCQDLPDFPASTTCYSIRPYKFHLVAMNITGPGGLDEELLLWSDAAAPGQVPQSWTAGTDSEAGDNVLGDETGAIIDGLALRDDFIIYKQHSTYVMTYVGGSEVMSFRKLFAGVGALNRNCVVEHKGYHYVLTDGDIVVHDGQTVKSIADDRIRETLFGLIDANFFRSAFVAANPPENEIYFCVPFGGISEPRRAFIYHTDSDTWGFREIPSTPHAAHGIVTVGVTPPPVDTWADMGLPWDLYGNRKWNQDNLTTGTVVDGLVFAQPSGTKTLFLDASTLLDGLVVDAEIQQFDLDLGTPEAVKIVRKVWPRLVASAGSEFVFKIGGRIELDEPVNFKQFTYTQGADNWVDVLVMGKYISFQMNTELDEIWQLTGFEIEFEERARF